MEKFPLLRVSALLASILISAPMWIGASTGVEPSPCLDCEATDPIPDPAPEEPIPEPVDPPLDVTPPESPVEPVTPPEPEAPPVDSTPPEPEAPPEDVSPPLAEEGIDDESMEEETTETLPVVEEERPTEEAVQEKITEKSDKSTDKASPSTESGLVGITLLSNMTLTGSYVSDKVSLTAKGRGLLDVALLSKPYVIFDIPTELMPYIDVNSLSGEYTIPGLIRPKKATIETSEWIIDSVSTQIYFDAEKATGLSISLLGSYEFTLEFQLTRLPVREVHTYTFKSQMTKEFVDLGVLTENVATWTLSTAGPTFFLTVPPVLDFGTQSAQAGLRQVYRTEAMGVTVSHVRALGFDWRLTASATPLRNGANHVLTNTVHFKRTDGTVVPLESGEQLIASGKMLDLPVVLTYRTNEGVFLDLTGKTPQATTYETTINWTLVNAP